MYTRSRSSTGGPGFGNGRGQINPGNGNSFQGPHSYNQYNQGGNYQQSSYKPGMLEPSAPFKPSGPPMLSEQEQAMQNRPTNQQQQNQNLQSPNNPPSLQKLKPILKNNPTTAGVQMTSTPSPVPPPARNSPADASQIVPSPAGAAPVVASPEVNPVTKLAPTAKPDANIAMNVGAVGEPVGNKTNEANEPSDQAEQAIQGEETPRLTDEDMGRWMDNDDQSGQWMDTEDGQAPAKNRREEWRRGKKLSAKKPNKVLKRLRMNRRLRKTLMPKNAIMVLNEMKAGVNFTFPETQAIMPNSLFLVHAELEGKVYVGQGLSKPLARQNAAENALKCLLLEKMTAAAMKERVETFSEGGATMEVNETPTITTEAPTEENGEETVEENDDIPWSSLASFALYKLFLEWQNQGTVVPIPRPGGPSLPKNRAEPKTLTDKVLPANALDIHPVMLLNQMRPGTTYNEVGRVGNPPNIQFTLGVEINGTTYTGTAKNKKDAKKIAAKEALTALFNLVYPEETKLEVVELAQ